MSDRSLLERLRHPERESARRAGDNPRERADSVLRHLQQMLNTRRGNVPAALDYGVPDLTEIVGNFPEAVGDMEHAIRRSIERYEPRLRDVRVSFTPSEDEALTLAFEISARLVMGGGATSVSFITRVNPEGKFEVRL